MSTFCSYYNSHKNPRKEVRGSRKPSLAAGFGDKGSFALKEKEARPPNGKDKDKATLTTDGGASHFDGSKSDQFDPADPVPFQFAELRAAIPKHCFVRDSWRSLSYAGRDIAATAILAVAAAHLNSWYFWPVYWVAQGLIFLGLFFIGHDCCHGAFSENTTLNNTVGYLVHTFLLIPHHPWRISHRSHHQNNGHADKDEAWVPVTESTYWSLAHAIRLLRFTVPFNLFSWPFYMLCGKLGAWRSHFNPYNELFEPSDRKDVIISDAWWVLMASLLVWGSLTFGVVQMLKLYVVPYMVFVISIDFVTYLQHHGHDEQLPWYRGQGWSYLKGGLSTIDVDYGWLNVLIHNAGTHVIHHIFTQIPHYHLREATEAVKPILGKYYREPQKSGPFLFHAIKLLIKSINRDHYVSDTGDLVYYQTDHELHKLPWYKKSK